MENISAKKSLGQNFLQDEKVLQKIADFISVQENDLLLEIGPGKGALTKYLIQKKCKYLAYEIDTRMKPVLEKYTDSIIWDDFLKRDLQNDTKDISYDNFYVVANIPYYITTPIIEHVIASKLDVKEMLLLVQKEVALRFCAKPHMKEYGFFTLFLRYYFDVSYVMDVSRYAFHPIPMVDSAVVYFRKKETKNIDEKAYFNFLKLCFSNKRKTLKNNLKEYEWSNIFSILSKYGYNEMVRAEEISEDAFLELYKSL